MPDFAEQNRNCSVCGASLPEDTLRGLCPKCLLTAGIQDEAGLHIRCPQCHVAIEIVDDESLKEITCPSCDSRFSLIGQQTETYVPDRPAVIGRFELIERVGIGAFGSVWKAHDPELDRVVAVKIPRKEQLDVDEAEQFLKEARSAAQLRHSGIVSVHEVGRDADRVYIVSDYIEGLTIADWLSGQKLTVRESAECCQQIATALQHAHDNGVIHRDLKPSNVMLDEEGRPHVMDFGLAKRDTGDVTMTADGRILGTPAYMSPEQARGKGHEADARSDVYSLGVILFELLTCEKPFRGTTRMLLHQVLHDDAPSPRKLNATLPRDLETICLKCLEKDPSRRYGTARDLADELQRFLRGEPILARPISRAGRIWRWCRRNPALAGAAATTAVSLVAVAAASIVLAVQQHEQQELVTGHNRELGRANDALEQANHDLNSTNSQLVAAEERRSEALLHASQLAVERADRFFSESQPSTGLLWLARALELSPDGASEWERSIRSHLADHAALFHKVVDVEEVGLPHRGWMSGAAASGMHFVACDVLEFLLKFDENTHTMELVDRTTGEQIHGPWSFPDSLFDGIDYDPVPPFPGSVDQDSRILTAVVSPDQRHFLLVYQRQQTPDGGDSLSDTYTALLLAEGRSLGEWPLGDTRHFEGFTPDSRRLVLVGEAGSWLVDLETGEATSMGLDVPANAHQFVLGPSSTRLACISGTLTPGHPFHEPGVASDLRVWDIGTGRLLTRDLRSDGFAYTAVTFLEDSSMLVTADTGGYLSLRNLETGEEEQTEKFHYAVTSLLLNSDGKYLLTRGCKMEDNLHLASLTTLWDARSLQRLDGPIADAHWIGFTSDGQDAVVVCENQVTVLAADGEYDRAELSHQQKFPSATVSTDRRFVLTTALDDAFTKSGDQLFVWDRASRRPNFGFSNIAIAETNATVGQPLDIPHGYSLVEMHMAINRVSRTLQKAYGHNGDSTILTTECPLKFVPHESERSAVVDGRLRYIETSYDATGETTIQLFESETGNMIGQPLVFRGSRDQFEFVLHPAGERILAVHWTDISLWDPMTGNQIGVSITGTFDGGFTPDGERIVVFDKDDNLIVYDANNLAPVGEPISPGSSGYGDYGVSPDGRVLVTASADDLEVRSLRNGRPIGRRTLLAARSREDQSVPWGIGLFDLDYIFSPDSGAFICRHIPQRESFEDGLIQIWSCDTGEPIGIPILADDVCFHPDGLTIAVLRDNDVVMYEVGSGAVVGEPIEHPDSIEFFSFNEDGSQLILIAPQGEGGLTGVNDYLLTAWDTSSRKEVLSIPVSDLFSPGRDTDQLRLPAGAAISMPAFDLMPDESDALGDVLEPVREHGKWFLDVDELLLDGHKTGMMTYRARLPDGSPERIRLWVETITGMELDENANAVILSSEEWGLRRVRLEGFGGAPSL